MCPALPVDIARVCHHTRFLEIDMSSQICSFKTEKKLMFTHFSSLLLLITFTFSSYF